jgi:hypothetical protein
MKLPGKLGLLLGVAGMICLRASSASALPGNEVETDYYTDRTFKTEVGSNTLLCTGGHFREGRITPFAIRFETPCRDEGGRTEISCIVDGEPTTCPLDLCDSELFSCAPVSD